jgi:hypothetical protein
VGTWDFQAACGSANLFEMQCPGATIDFSPTANGTYTFNADGTYATSLSLEESGTETIPASCLAGITDCTTLDTMITSGGLNVTIASCSGNASQSCTCTVSVSETLTDTGKYTTAGNDVSLTSNGGAPGTQVGYCVAGSTLQIADSPSNDAYVTLSKQ